MCPVTVDLLVFMRQNAHRRRTGGRCHDIRNPMGPEKASQIALDCDPRTPLYGERGERDSYSKVWDIQSPKIPNANPD